jgi:hypothetical protein
MDNINPAHYKRNGGMECIDAIEAMVAGWPAATAYRLGNVLKYLWRHREKGQLESLKKARWYLDREIAALEAANRESKLPNSQPEWERKLARVDFDQLRQELGL